MTTKVIIDLLEPPRWDLYALTSLFSFQDTPSKPCKTTQKTETVKVKISIFAPAGQCQIRNLGCGSVMKMDSIQE